MGLPSLNLNPSQAKRGMFKEILSVIKKIYVILIAIKLPGPLAKKILARQYSFNIF